MKKPSNQISQMTITYPNEVKQVVKPNLEFFQGDWQGLAKAIAGLWYLDHRGNIGYVPMELH